MVDEVAAPEAASPDPEAPQVEVGASSAEPDETMEIATADAPEAVNPEVGAIEETEGDPEPASEEPAAADDEEDDEEEDEDEVEEESSLADKQADYVSPSPTPQLDSVQNAMVAGANLGEEQRRATIARNRETRDQQHAALGRTNRPDNA